MEQEIIQQLSQVRASIASIERGLKPPKKFEPKISIYREPPDEVQPDLYVNEFNIQLQAPETPASLFDMSVVPMEMGGFGIDMQIDQEFSVGVAEVNMELASMGSSEMEFVCGEAEIEFAEAAGTDIGGAEYDAGEAESE
ncbi:MAG: hypothetical protein E6P95_01670 [Candidatus Moraniibacteriota bacterium]|nr:MAG: hypothetical protein E6P95_01670 [Candidatus Moranbacteria bacterium]